MVLLNFSLLKPLIKENLREKLYFYCLLYLVLSLPFQFIWFPPTLGIIFLMLTWIFSFDFQKKISLLKKNLLFKIIFGLFLMSLVGMIYSPSPDEGWKDVTVKISLFFFPIALGSYPPISREKIVILLKTFAFAMGLAVLYLILNASLKYFDDGDYRHFFYGSFGTLKRVPIHYFALYCNFAFFISLDLFFNKINRSKKALLLLYGILILLLITALFLCSIRIQFIAFILTLILFFIRQFRGKMATYKIALSIIGSILLLSMVALIIPESKRRITETLDEYSAYRGREELKQMNHRVFLWKYGSRVIKENYWLGTGTGNANNALYEYLKTEKAKFWNGTGVYTLSKKKYNYHNAFLQHFAANGVIAIVLLIALLLLPFFGKSHEFSMIQTLFLILIVISFMTESMMERQAGTLFFAFFYSLIVINQRGKVLTA